MFSGNRNDHCRVWLWSIILVGVFFIVPQHPALGQAEFDQELSEEESKQVQIAERFLTVLEKSPRRGTALDRVYGHHVEFGTLDSFLASLRERVTADPQDGAGWMLLGLFESQRGQDADAVDAFRKAEQLRPDDPLAAYYLGQSLLLIGQPEEAIQACERAISRNPQRTDLLEIFQQLGRVHQRAQRTEEALKVWERLESLFPDDPRVQEQIAATLLDEGAFAQALPRYEKLAEISRDDYRRVMFRIQAAGIKVRENQRDAGLKDLETLLGELNPESWLHRDVRRRIEEVFLKSGDQDGVVRYYLDWLAMHPEDVDAMARLAKFLASSGRVPEATEWMEKALKLAPTRTELRKSFIDQLVDEHRFGDAVRQYALLNEASPGNADFLRDWGKLVLRDKDQPEEERKQEAVRIWNMILASRPNDALACAQVADLFRQASMSEEALRLYQQAVELAPAEPQYREYLGEYYHILKRPEEARETWAAIARGANRNAVNVARLGEVYNSFGYLDDAVVQIADACLLDPKDFSLHLTSAEFHSRAGKYDDALKYLEEAGKLSASEEEKEAVVAKRIEVFQASQRLDEETSALAARVKSTPDSSAADWHLLARYLEADRRWADATEAIDTSLKKDAKAIPALSTAARIAEQSGDFGRAADMNRQLAAIDRRSRGDHLMNIARLESQMGRSEEALQAGRELIISAPGNTDNYEFYAQLCFRLGKFDEGLETLRKAVRINPTEPHLIMALGAALSEQFRTDEAIEVYWRAFEKMEEVEDKTSLTIKLTELYLQINQFDKLIERFERDRREEAQRREMTICLAQAYHSSGDFGTARQELEGLLSQETRDTNLLQQLSKLCEEGSDLGAAVDYQRRLVEIAPGHETEFRLASLLQRRGDRDEASEILIRLTRREEDRGRLLSAIDSLLNQADYSSVLAITEPLINQQKDEWELLYREGVSWALMEKTAEARDRFQRLLSINLPHDALGYKAEERFKRDAAKSRSDNLRGIRSQLPQRQSPLTMLNMSSQVKYATGLLDDNRYYGSNTPSSMWTPEAFGLARMAAYGWLLKFEADQLARIDITSDAKPPEAGPNSETGEKSFVEPIVDTATSPNATRDQIYDYLYIQSLRDKQDAILGMARRLAQEEGKEEKQFYLRSLAIRNTGTETPRSGPSGSQTPQAKPLSDEDLAFMLDCYQKLSQEEQSEESLAASYGGQVIFSSTGQAYVLSGGSYYPIGGVSSGSIFLNTILNELKLAGRNEQAEQLLNENLAKAKTATQLVSAMSILFEKGKDKELEDYFQKWIAAAKEDISRTELAAVSTRQRGRSAAGVSHLNSAVNTLNRWIGKLGAAEEHQQILKILDQGLDLAVMESLKRQAMKQSQFRSRPGGIRQNVQSNYYLQWYYGQEIRSVNISYPQANDYVDQGVLNFVRQVYEVLRQNEVLTDLTSHLQARASNARDDQQVFESLILGYVLWWSDDQEGAVAILSDAASRLQDDPAFALEMASLQEQMGNLDDALTIVEGIIPRDQNLVQMRETVILRLSERLGDIERARQSAERLFGLRLDTNSQVALIEQTRRLGMYELSEAILNRIQRRTANDASSMAMMMNLYQGQGKTDLAQQMAQLLLRRTTYSQSILSTSSRNPYRYRSGDDSLRQQALRVLQQTGAMKTLIERLEVQIEQSPDSLRLYDQLIEFYGAAGEREKAQAMVLKVVKTHPENVSLRLSAARQLEQAGQVAEACDHYLVVLDRQPRWIAEDLYSIQRTFERANRQLDLIKGLQKVNLKSLGQPYYIMNLISNSMRPSRNRTQNDETQNLMLDLFERTFNEYPTYRSQMLNSIYEPTLWKNDRVFELGKKAILASQNDTQADPWYGLNDVNSYSSNGTVSGMFHRLLQGVKGSSKLDELHAAISAQVQQVPGWHGGRAMLALIDLEQGKKDQARDALVELSRQEEVRKTMNGDTCWIIGQVLDQFDSSQPVAIELFEHAATTSQAMNQLQYSPTMRLVKLYLDTGRKEEARKVLLTQMKKSTESEAYYDPQYTAYLRIQNSIWAADKLYELGFPVDAVKMYRTSLNDQDGLAQANRFSSEQYESRAQAGLKKALGMLDKVNADEAVGQLLVLPEQLKPGMSALDLMVSVPRADRLRSEQISSQLLLLLKSVSRSGQITSSIQKKLLELQDSYPDDVSIAVTSAAYLLQQQHPDSAASLDRLINLVDRHPLEEVASGRRPNSRQRKEAAAFIPVWLVARECLQNDVYQAQGQKLADLALQAALRQVSTDSAVAILFDWGEMAAKSGDKVTAEQKWTEILDLVTKRPERKAPAAGRTTSGFWPVDDPRFHVVFQDQASPDDEAPAENPSADRVPPLTLSQFRLAMQVAQAASENGMPELSRKAVQASLIGGLPVPDAATDDSSNRMARIPSGSAAGGPAGSDAIEAEVANSIQKVLKSWNATDYPAHEVFQLLVPIIFPRSRPTDILLYADSTQLADAQVTSLGATLVKWSRIAGTLEELNQEISQRESSPQTRVPALVLRTLTALAVDNYGQAEQSLKALAEIINAGTQVPLLQMACHAALPASEHESLQPASYDILHAAVRQLAGGSSEPGSSSGEVASAKLGELTKKVNRYLSRHGGTDEVRKYLESWLLSRQSYYSRYSGDYGMYLQAQDWAALADQAASAGAPLVAMDFMGRVADFSYENYSRPSSKLAMATVCRELSLLPAAERYVAWRNWTLPVEGRRTVRLTAEWIHSPEIPAVFLKQSRLRGSLPAGDVLCNLTELISSAQEAGQLDDLQSRTRAALDDKIPNAEFLWPLVQIQFGEQDARKSAVEEFVKSLPERNRRDTSHSRPPRKDLWGDYLVYRACMESPELAGVFQNGKAALDEAARSYSQTDIRARLDFDDGLRQVRELGAQIQPGDGGGLVNWHTHESQPVYMDATKPWWAVNEGHLIHLGGPTSDLLGFAFPLSGEFTFSAEGYWGQGAQSNLGFGGIIAPGVGSGTSTVWSVGHNDNIRVPSIGSRGTNTFNRLELRVASGMASFFINNQLYYEEPASPTSPWLLLHVNRAGHSAFRNLKITGQPVIPQEVPLFSGNRMDGWSTSFFGETQPRLRIMAARPQGENDQLSYEQRNEPARFDWLAQDGMLIGEANQDSSATAQSWICYQRPLQDQETFRYEFYFVPGVSVAQPTIGRLAFLLQPEGVSTHWISRTGWDDLVLGVPLSNVAVETAARRGPDNLPLKSNDWNQVEVTLKGSTASVSLNGTLVFERPLEADHDRRFGLFRNKQQSLKVRNAVLTGPWPDRLSEDVQRNLLATNRTLSTVDAQIIHNIAADEFALLDCHAIVSRAQTLPEDEAWKLLSDWVLPVDGQRPIRMYYEQIPFVDPENATDEIACPARELVGLAKRRGSLHELAQTIADMKSEGPAASRNQKAFQALIAIHSDDHRAALLLMKDLYGNLDNQEILPKSATRKERAPEYVVAWEAARIPELQFPAEDFVTTMLSVERDREKGSTDADWKKDVYALSGRVKRLQMQLQDSRPVDDRQTQWTSVPYLKPEHFGQGHHPSTWILRRGSAEHIPGETWTQLFFQSPLTGKFEIVADRALHGYREVSLSYSMHSAEPRYDFKATRVYTVMHGQKDLDGDIGFSKPGWMATQHIAVDGSTVTTSYNGVQIHQETLSPAPDPWICLQASSPENQSVIRNLRILGNPQIPDEIRLLETWNWVSLRADNYGDWRSPDGSDENAPWRRSGEELLGAIRDKDRRGPRESLLMYQRPLLEDGVIEFESYFVPGEFEVHPAIGGTALMIRPDGVRLHTLTHAQWELRNLDSDNEAALPGTSTAVPLKPQDWNRYRLSVKGDELKISINDTEIATYSLGEPHNERFFGLFRYCNRTQCRVRNLVYRGDWPRTLPRLEDQYLASPVTDELAIPEAGWKPVASLDMKGNLEQLKTQGLAVIGRSDGTSISAAGTRLLLQKADGYATWPGVVWNYKSLDDCAVTVELDRFQMTPAKQGWGCAVRLRMDFESETALYVETGLGLNQELKAQLQSVVTHVRLDGSNQHDARYQNYFQDIEEIRPGRLRLVRRGTIVDSYYAPSESDQFRHIESHYVGNRPIRTIRVQNYASDPVATVDATISRFEILSRPATVRAERSSRD